MPPLYLSISFTYSFLILSFVFFSYLIPFLSLLFCYTHTHKEENRELRERLMVREFKAWAPRVKPRGRGRGREILQLKREGSGFSTAGLHRGREEKRSSFLCFLLIF
jgi:hypothetical protein